MAHESQINSVIVKINMDSTGNELSFVVEEVTTQPGLCFEGTENLLRARFECLCCKTGYVVLPLIFQTVQMKVTITENDPTTTKKVVEHVFEEQTGSTFDTAVDSAGEQKQCDEFDNFKMEEELFLLEDSFEMAPVENQARVDQTTDLEEDDFVQTHTESLLDEVVNSHEEQEQDDGLEGSEMKNMTFPMDVDPDSVETPSVKQPTRAEQTLDLEERSLKLQCLRSKPVIRMVRVNEEARQMDASITSAGPQKQSIEGGFYTCDICKATVKHRHSLIRHMNTHLGIRFSCPECPKSFSDISHLDRHMKIHMGIRFLCSECQASFSKKYQLLRHNNDFHQSEFRICEVCGESKICTKAEYNSHLRRRHPEFISECRQMAQNFNKVDFPCIYCEPQATFMSFEELECHLRVTHHWNFACTLCPLAFTFKGSFEFHIESTHKKKTFNCPRCDKIFLQKTALYAHFRIHK